MIHSAPARTVPLAPHLIPGWIRALFVICSLAMTYLLPLSPQTRWLIFSGLCAVFSVLSFSCSLFMMAGLAICEGKLGFVAQTFSGVIMDDVYMVELTLPFFILSYCLEVLKHPDRVKPLWSRYSSQFLALAFLMLLLASVCFFETPWKDRAIYQYMHVVTGFIYFVMISSLNQRRLLQLVGSFAFWGLVYFVMAQFCILGYEMDYGSIQVTRELLLQLDLFEGKVRACLMAPPSVTAVTMGLCTWSMIYMACLGKGWKRIVLSLLAFISAVGVFYTRTRSEMVAMLMGVLMFTSIIAWPRRGLIRAWVVGIVLIALTWVAAAAIDFANALDRLAMSADMSEQASMGVRLDLWKKGFHAIANNYGFGMGTGGFFLYKDDWPHAHDIYFSVLFDLGIPGMILWGCIFLGLIRWLLHATKQEAFATPHWMAFACCAGFATEMAFTGLLQDEYTTFIWTLFPAIILATLNRYYLSHDIALTWGRHPADPCV